MNDIYNLSFFQVGAAYVFVVIVLVILRMRGIKREKALVISSIRMTLQLILVGYLLVYVFDNSNPFITLAILLVMQIFSIHTVFRTYKNKLSPSLKKVIALSMSIGTLACIAYFLFVVIQISPWYNPQYFIPITGMIVGNSMTGISLGTKALTEGMSLRKIAVEEALILGASPKEAVKSVINSSFDGAILPTINSMIGMGIVFLPGMMTGQILSGVSPTTAIAYQIAIMLSILGAVSLTVIIMLTLGYKTYFNEQSQLAE